MSTQTKSSLFLGHDLNDPRAQTQLLEALKKKIKGGTPLKEALHCSDEMIESLYGIGYAFYTGGDFFRALEVFHHLVLLNPFSYRFAFALASAAYKLKDYQTALIAYMLALTNEMTNPMPAYCLAECGMELNNLAGARDCCEAAIELAGNNPEHRVLKERATLMLQKIGKRLKS